MIRSKLFYGLACDHCGEMTSDWEYDSPAYWPEPAVAIEQGRLSPEVDDRSWLLLGRLLICDEALRAFREYIGALDDDHSAAGWLWDAVDDIRYGGPAGKWAEAVLRVWIWRSS